MKKKTVAFLSCAAVLLTILGVYVSRQDLLKRSSKQSDDIAPQSLLGNELVEQTESIRKEISAGPRYGGIDSAGIKTFIRGNYNAQTPLVEILFFMRDLKGQITPVALSDVELQSWDISSGGGSYTLGNAIGMRMIVSEEGHSFQLQMGGKYHLLDYRIHGEQAYKSTEPIDTTFQVPNQFPSGSLYRIKLLVIDKIAEADQVAQKAAKARKLAELAQKESITIRFSGADQYDECMVHYFFEGKERHKTYSADPSLVLPGPNPLGGEFAITYVTNTQKPLGFCVFVT